jgi:hypothetical protein
MSNQILDLKNKKYGNYNFKNCIFIPMSEQNKNKRNVNTN